MAIPSSTAILERAGISLVFGMEWFPLLGNHPEGQARSLARRRRAGHWVLTAGAAASAGLLRARLPRRRGQRCGSAAAAFARQHPAGTIAAVLSLPGGRQWLVAVHEGAVMTSTDYVHDNTALLEDTIRLLRDAHPALILLDDDASNGLLDTLFERARDNAVLLRARPRFEKRAMAALVAAALASGGTWITQGWGWRAGSAGSAEHVDPVVAWQGAVAASLQAHTLQGVAGLRAALDAIYEVPVVLAAWHLAEVECRPRGSHWHCRARYRRGPGADNQRLLAAVDPGWELSFDPLDGAEAAWSVSLPARPLRGARLNDARRNEARLFSVLQEILPAFSQLRLDAAQPLPVRVPLDAHQRPIPRPERIAEYRRRPLRLQAPLRSLSLFLPETMHMSWDRILVQVVQLDQPTLRGSRLRASLSGVLYETENSGHAVVDSSGIDFSPGGGDGGAGAGGGADHRA